ncbi:putative MO25-like protein At5g47540 [Lolium rigidum]|uniref:putative MO25-like protein At5g47540 n=1 Tax=Lolium rigidum TaxID=89674 RepID=UPI001F5CDD4F|nr:putative MO25-like protein At5g47540 [Lolium rigidum]
MTGCLWPCVSGTNAKTAGSGGLFRSKPRSPTELVRHMGELLRFLSEHPEPCGGKLDGKREQKMEDLSRAIRETKFTLYGNGDAEPIAEACSQLTKEFFKENILRLIIVNLPHMDLETQKDVTQVIANLQRQKVDSRIIASDYLEVNQDLLDTLVCGYDNTDIAIHYSSMLRDCIRHQVAARYVLSSQHMKKFFDYIQFPDFNLASDAFKTFKELLTRHKSTAAEFFNKSYDWFFPEFNSKLLQSSNYIIRRQSIQLLGDILLERLNSSVMVRYVSSKENLIVLMNLLREQSKAIQIEAFRVFKLFTANQNKPREIVSILLTNKSKILRFLKDFIIEKEDRLLESDKEQVSMDILAMEL